MSKISLYGSVALKKDYCSDCKSDAFVVGGIIKCCGRAIGDIGITAVKREIESLGKRLGTSFKNRILNAQHYGCYLCGVDLRQVWFYRRGSKMHKLHTEFDHFIPRSFCASNEFENIYAMCNLCNKYKSSKMFNTRQDAIDYVVERRKSRGVWDLYSDIEVDAAMGKNEKM